MLRISRLACHNVHVTHLSTHRRHILQSDQLLLNIYSHRGSTKPGRFSLCTYANGIKKAKNHWRCFSGEDGIQEVYDTIVAIVTGGQQGAVSIIRLSGPDAVDIAKQVFVPQTGGKNGTWDPVSHRIYYGTAVDERASIIDEVLVLVMLGPRSYTAEDVVEIHTHGGGICASRVLQCCLQAGSRLAQPGEFTLRAFLNGRLDLSQAESVSSLVSARTVAAADSALAGLS